MIKSLKILLTLTMMSLFLACGTPSALKQVEIDEWTPLKTVNYPLYERLSSSIDEFGELQTIFNLENDEFYLGVSFYLLKLFVDMGDQSLNAQDISISLKILEQKYQFTTPEILAMIIQKIDHLKLENNQDGTQSISFFFKNQEDIKIDLTQVLAGRFTGSLLKPQAMLIDHGGKLTVYSDTSKSKKVTDQVAEFARSIHDISIMRDLITKDTQDSLLEYAANVDHPNSPLFINVTGINMEIDVVGMFSMEPQILNILVTPSLMSQATGKPLPSFHVNAQADIFLMGKMVGELSI